MKRYLQILSVPALLLLTALAVGCGGGDDGAPRNASNQIQGATSQGTGTTTTPLNVPPSNGLIQTLSVNGVPAIVVIPSGAPTNISTGTPLAVVRVGSTLLQGTFFAGANVAVNGNTTSGVNLNADGSLAQSAALPVNAAQGTDYTLDLPQGNIETRALTVRNGIHFSGRFYFRNGAIVSPLPLSLSGTIPNNGESAMNSVVTATFGPGNNGRTARLTVDYGNGFVLDQTRTIQNNQVTFRDLAADSSAVPPEGIRTLSFIVGP